MIREMRWSGLCFGKTNLQKAGEMCKKVERPYVGAGVDILQVPGNVDSKLGNRSGLVIKVWESGSPLSLPSVHT